MNLRSAAGIFISVFCSASCTMAPNSVRVEGTIGGFPTPGVRTLAVAGVDVYVFREEDIHQMLRRDGKLPDAVTFFDSLPYSKAVVHTESAAYDSGTFRLSLPCKGNYVIAARCGLYPCDRTGKQLYWLIPISVGTVSIKIELDGSNTVDTPAAGAFKLDMKNCYTVIPGKTDVPGKP